MNFFITLLSVIHCTEEFLSPLGNHEAGLQADMCRMFQMTNGEMRSQQTWKFVLLNKTSVHAYKCKSNKNLKNVKKDPIVYSKLSVRVRSMYCVWQIWQYAEKCQCCT